MTTTTFSPPAVEADQVLTQLRERGYAVLNAATVGQWAACALPDLLGLRPDWDGLPPDNFLKDGGRYRRRRHSCFVVQGEQVEQVPHRAH